MNYKSAIAALIIGSSAALASLPATASSQAAPVANSVAVSQSVNINSANAKVLSADLNGIGPVKAQAIVSYRQSHGNFKRVQDLAEVKGIGPKTVAENRDHIRLK